MASVHPIRRHAPPPPRRRDLELTHEALDLPANPDWFVFAFTAEPGGPSEERLGLLGSLAASPAQNRASGH